MNAKQFNAALNITVVEAMKSCGRDIDPAQIVGLLEMHKQAVLGHIAQAQAQAASQIIPFRGNIPNGE